MKMNKIISICATIALLGSGCSDDMGLQSDKASAEGTAQIVRISASMGDKGSRLAYDETDSALNLTWGEDDVLKVLNPTRDNLITDFALVDGDGTTLAHFEGTPENAYQAGDSLYVLYHNNLAETDLDEDGNVIISMNEQDGTLKDDNHIMFGTAVYEGEGSVLSMKLSNISSIIKVTIPTDKTLTSVCLTSGFPTQAKLVLHNNPSDSKFITFKPGDLVENGYTMNYEAITLTGRFEPVNGEVIVYFHVIPADVYWPDSGGYGCPILNCFFIAYDEDGNEYASTKYIERTIDKGKLYEIRSEIFEIVDFDNEATADGSPESPYEIATKEQLYSFMYRCDNDKYNNTDQPYTGLSYKLTSDIVLDNTLFWKDINFNGTFDGDGHTVSGSITNPFISYLSDATVCNLVLDLEFVERNGYWYSEFAALARDAYNVTIKNVVNHSSINGSSWCLGGLVSSMSGGSVMIGCGNTGNLSVNDFYSEKVTTMGGLVGNLSGDCKVEACYNTGNLTANIVNEEYSSYFGGLVGFMSQYEENGETCYHGTLASSWTSGTLNIGSGYDPHVNDIVGSGAYTACYMVESGATPTAEQYAAMNDAMTNEDYEFDVTTGTIVQKKP